MSLLAYGTTGGGHRPVLEDDGKKNSPKNLLHQGYVHPDIQHKLDVYIDTFEKTTPTEPLTFTELTRYSTWFAMHPEKVAGKEELTTSFHFPITIKGNRELIEQTIRAGIEAAKVSPGPQQQKQSGNQESSRKKQIAKFKLKAMLLKLDGLGGYTQTQVLEVENIYKGLSRKELIAEAESNYKKLFGEIITNYSTGHRIELVEAGKNKTIFGRYKKVKGKKIKLRINSLIAIAILYIEDLIKFAKHEKVSPPKPNHIEKFEATHIHNYTTKILIDGELKVFVITVIQTKNKKFKYLVDFAEIAKSIRSRSKT